MQAIGVVPRRFKCHTTSRTLCHMLVPIIRPMSQNSPPRSQHPILLCLARSLVYDAAVSPHGGPLGVRRDTNANLAMKIVGVKRHHRPPRFPSWMVTAAFNACFVHRDSQPIKPRGGMATRLSTFRDAGGRGLRANGWHSAPPAGWNGGAGDCSR